MCLLNRLALASRAEDNGCVSSLVTKIFIRKIIQKYVYWAKPGLGEYEGSSLLYRIPWSLVGLPCWTYILVTEFRF